MNVSVKMFWTAQSTLEETFNAQTDHYSWSFSKEEVDPRHDDSQRSYSKQGRAGSVDSQSPNTPVKSVGKSTSRSKSMAESNGKQKHPVRKGHSFTVGSPTETFATDRKELGKRH